MPFWIEIMDCVVFYLNISMNTSLYLLLDNDEFDIVPFQSSCKKLPLMMKWSKQMQIRSSTSTLDLRFYANSNQAYGHRI